MTEGVTVHIQQSCCTGGKPWKIHHLLFRVISNNNNYKKVQHVATFGTVSQILKTYYISRSVVCGLIVAVERLASFSLCQVFFCWIFSSVLVFGPSCKALAEFKGRRGWLFKRIYIGGGEDHRPNIHEFNHHLLKQLALQLQQEFSGYFSSVRPPAARHWHFLSSSCCHWQGV